jgi:hypothetical protein
MRIVVGAILGLLVGIVAGITVWGILSVIGVPDNVSSIPSGLMIWGGPVAGELLRLEHVRTGPAQKTLQYHRSSGASAEAMDWTALAQTAMGAAAAIGGGFVGAWVQGRTLERMEQQQRLERAAEVLAEVTAILEDSNLNMLDGDGADEELAALLERWDQVRMRLLMVATSHPSPRVRDRAGTLNALLLGSLSAMTYAIQEQGEDHERRWEVARGIHGRATEGLGELVDALQQA